jgi:hypothetical protein
MPMKISLALGPVQPLSRQTAWGCLTANVALPGSGSLAAGRVSGYLQLALAVGGLILTMSFGTRYIVWAVANWSKLYGPQADPYAAFGETWLRLRWALLGMGLFGMGWLWGLATGLQMVRNARKNEPPGVPPRLG